MTKVEIEKRREIVVPVPVAAVLVTKYESPTSYFLLSKRLVPPEVNRLDVPGGRREEGETSIDCAKRELREEAGIVVPSASDNFYPLFHGKQIFLESKRAYYCHGFVVFWEPEMEVPQRLEPTKHAPWQWYSEEQILNLRRENQLSALTEELFRAFYMNHLFFGYLLPEIGCENLEFPYGWGQDRIIPR